MLLTHILNLKNGKKTNLGQFKTFVKKSKSAKKSVNIAVAGKYFKSGEFVLSDVYISVIEALKFSAYKFGAKPIITYLNTRDFDNLPAGRQVEEKLKELAEFDGILVPGGFGETGIEKS